MMTAFLTISLAVARGVSQALEKQWAKRRLKEARSFEHVAQRWMDTAPMADSTRNMRRSIFNREVLPQWRTRLLNEITPDDLSTPDKSSRGFIQPTVERALQTLLRSPRQPDFRRHRAAPGHV